ncbi:hypothetical protein [Photorhabdus hainanensis]|uniref:hypothetical protein n=1 Tax=Photorhabdus hainanensis TaxID=1004166 RepID=UPI001BD577A1|nr:hypothetical protein [Photorhabdus hainanensis]
MMAAIEKQIGTIDMRTALGQRYINSLNDRALRTGDGVHITEYGADLLVNLLTH